MRPNARVRHVALDIIINVTLPDLGHPELPGLWERLREKPIRKGEMICLECAEEDPLGEPVSMYLREQNGHRVAAHFPRKEQPPCMSAPESDKHKAMKELWVRIAEREGLTARVEAHAGSRVRSDVEITGGTVPLSMEAELKSTTAENVMARSRRRQAQGLQPLWCSDNRKAAFAYRVPSAITDPTEPWRLAAGLDTRVLEGVKTLRSLRCGDDGIRCPQTGGRTCGRLHLVLAPAQGLHIDKLIVGAASGDYRTVAQASKKHRYHYWLRADEWSRYMDDRAGAAIPLPTDDDDEGETVPQLPRELTGSCNRHPGAAHSADALDRQFATDGTCQVCGADASLYPAGWRCAAHPPATARWDRAWAI